MVIVEPGDIDFFGQQRPWILSILDGKILIVPDNYGEPHNAKI